MFNFMVHQILGIVDATYVIGCLNEVVVDLKFSPEMFAIIASPSPTRRCIIALQLFPQFFDGYWCHKLQYSWIYIDDYFPVLFNMRRCGFTSFSFSSEDQDHNAELTFQDPYGYSREVTLELSPSNDSMDVGEFDWGSFVSIDSPEFINIVTALINFESVLVTLTNSQVKFSCGRRELILPQESGHCIIGSVVPSNQIHFVITLHAWQIFHLMAHQSKWVWLFKSNNSSKGVISVPLGLYARFLAYFPNRI